MRISTAYFAGVGTVIAAVSAGLGGGYLAANMTHPPTQTVSKLERRMSAEPITVSTAPAEPVPHVAAADPTKPAAAPAQEQTPQQPQTQQQSQTQTEAAAPPAATFEVICSVRGKERRARGILRPGPRGGHQPRGCRKGGREAAVEVTRK